MSIAPPSTTYLRQAEWRGSRSSLPMDRAAALSSSSRPARWCDSGLAIGRSLYHHTARSVEVFGPGTRKTDELAHSLHIGIEEMPSLLPLLATAPRSEEHTSELQSLRISVTDRCNIRCQ